LAGLLAVIYFFVGRTLAPHASAGVGNPPEPAKRNAIPLHKKALWVILYTTLTILFMLATWPYLWESPLKNFFQVFLFMSENPTGLQVLFNGEVYRAYELPRRYLPTLLAVTLTEPIWPLFILGIGAAFTKLVVSIRPSTSLRSAQVYSTTAPTINHDPFSTDYWLTLTAFIIPYLYVILRKPPMYDGFRHFLFILPPVFVTCGLGLNAVFGWLRNWVSRNQWIYWLHAIIILTLILPGVFSAAQLHPYEYTYYNSLVGGTGDAFRAYETDYWLTCYKEAVEQLNNLAPRPANLFVHREAYIAAGYAADGITVRDERGNLSAIQSGDYLLVNTRTNEDRKTFHGAPVALEIGRGGATFCVVKQVP
jgi:hypothetical protein